MVLMSAGKAARHQASITRKTTNLGGDKKGGLASSGVGVDASTRPMLVKHGVTKTLPARGITTAAQMRARNILSVNPQSSGGVGKKTLMFSR